MNNDFFDYIPKDSHLLIRKILFDFTGIIKVSNPRKSKLGDYRAKNKNGIPQITVNSDLNPYSFLVTLVHEIAHHEVYKKFKHSVSPHGLEWKIEFSELLTPFLSGMTFPENIKEALNKYLKNPSASSCVDANLYKKLRLYDQDVQEGEYINELSEGDLFEYDEKGLFKVLEKRRTRTLCLSMSKKKKYLFQPTVKVQIVHV